MEKIKTGKFAWHMIKGKHATKDVAQNFAAIYCSNASLGVGPENLFIPYRSSLLLGLFYDFSLEESTELIFSMLDNWFKIFDGMLKQEIVLVKVKSMVKLNAFELSNIFHALIRVLTIMIIRVRKSEGKEMGYLRHIQSKIKERLPLYISSCYFEFREFLLNVDLLFTSHEITADDWFDKKIDPYYVDKIGFDDYPFILILNQGVSVCPCPAPKLIAELNHLRYFEIKDGGKLEHFCSAVLEHFRIIESDGFSKIPFINKLQFQGTSLRRPIFLVNF